MKIESTSYPLAESRNASQRATGDSDAKSAVQSVEQVSGTHAQNASVSLSTVFALSTSSESDIDTAKVESIKAALRNGTYTIDSGKIADGILGTAHDLLQTTTRAPADGSASPNQTAGQ